MSQIINGKEVAAGIRAEVAEEVLKLRAANGRHPKLVVIQVGDNPASSTYVRKKKACEECGIECEDIHLPKEISQFELNTAIDKTNRDDTVDGILVQLPLPEHINERVVVNMIDSRKDVDGFTLANAGKLLAGEDCTLPCTPAGVIELLRSTGVNLTSKNAVVIGRSNIVGKPMVLLLQRENMNVTMLHSKTSQEDMEFYCRHADVVVVATGHENTLTDRHFYGGKNPIIIDVGINRGADGKLRGDVSEEVKAKYSSYYTPVPGGVGPMTIAMLMKNVIRAYKQNNSTYNAELLYNAGYRKQGNVTREIFDEIEKLVSTNKKTVGCATYEETIFYIEDFIEDLAELKKKYTEESK